MSLGWAVLAAVPWVLFPPLAMLRVGRSRSLSDELASLPEQGVTSYKLFMAYKGALQVDDETLFKSMEVAAGSGALVMVHAENGDAIDVLETTHGFRSSRIHRCLTVGSASSGRAPPAPLTPWAAYCSSRTPTPSMHPTSYRVR